MAEITQVIDELPTAPDPFIHGPDQFPAIAAAFVLAQKDMVPQVNEWSQQANALAEEVSEQAEAVATGSAEAIAASEIAVASGNYAGLWSLLTGAKSAGISVSHKGVLWMLLVDVADVAAVEPGLDEEWGAINPTAREVRTANIELTAADTGKVIEYTVGGYAQTLISVEELGQNWYAHFANKSVAAVTFDPAGAETINGASTLALDPGMQAFVICDGAALYAYLTPLMIGSSSEYDAGNSGTAATIAFTNGRRQKLTLTGNVTLQASFAGCPVGNYQVKLVQDGTGGRTITWSTNTPGMTRWIGSSGAPSHNTAASSETIVNLYWDGTNAYGTLGRVNSV